METLPAIEMLPTKYEPKFTNRFILDVDGIDSFIVQSVQLPKISVANDHLGYLTKLEVALYDPIAPSGSQQVMEFCKKAAKGKKISAGIKLLDAVGTVVSHWVFTNVKPDYVDFGDLSYDTATPKLIKMSLSFDKMTLKY